MSDTCSCHAIVCGTFNVHEVHEMLQSYNIVITTKGWERQTLYLGGFALEEVDVIEVMNNCNALPGVSGFGIVCDPLPLSTT